MPILRLNAGEDGLRLHGSPADAMPALCRAASGKGPVIIMIHGFKYDPESTDSNPHSTIFAQSPRSDRSGDLLWPRHLGFGSGRAEEGLAIAYGWRARGNIWRAQRSARTAGLHLGRVIRQIRRIAPDRPISMITHSMGSEVAFEALEALPAGAVHRLVTLTGASYAGRAASAMQSPAGRQAELFNITTRENDFFDFAFERLISPPELRDCAMGGGVNLQNVANIQLDCPRTLCMLRTYGAMIAPPARRVCHWSGYTRPGAMRFYATLMRQPEQIPLHALKTMLPQTLAPRWSRILARPIAPLPLPELRNPAT